VRGSPQARQEATRSARAVAGVTVRVLQKLGFLEEGMRRDYLYIKERFHSFRWFSLLETDELRGPCE
jgi:hypothetical protein